jgi:hypothetical protein
MARSMTGEERDRSRGFDPIEGSPALALGRRQCLFTANIGVGQFELIDPTGVFWYVRGW